MTKVAIKHLDRYTDRHGKIRLYFRNRSKGGNRSPLRGPEGSPEFWKDYLAASDTPVSKATNAPKVEQLRWLINQYYTCANFKELDPRTQYVRKGRLTKLCEMTDNNGRQYGEKSFAQITPKVVRQKIRDRMAETPSQANNVLKDLRQVFKYAVEYEIATHNPIVEVAYLKSKNKSGFHAWTLAEVEQYEAYHPIGTKARLTLGLLLYTLQRRSDIVTLGRQHERDGLITLTQQKTDSTLSIPIRQRLRKLLDASPTGDMTYLVTTAGKPFTANGFGNKFRMWCNEAGLPHCSAHGLRKAGAYRLAEDGCSANEIAAMGGWQSLKDVEHYTKAAAQVTLAKQAIARSEAKDSLTSGQCFPNLGKEA